MTDAVSSAPPHWRSLLAGERQMFVVVNVAVNLLLLVRSYVTMQVLDYRGLGLAALLQSIVLLVGTFQLGFLNGGFRLICAAEGREAERINDAVFTFFAILSALAFAVAGGSLLFVSGGEADLVALLGVIGGILTLVRTWLMNRMVASGHLARLNRINFWSAAGSVAVLAAIPWNPLAACLAAVVAQPLFFVLAVALLERALLPGGFETDPKLVRAIVRAGFVVFLTGLFLQVNLQLERWYVTGALGIEALGHLYLAYLFVTLFQLVPTSVEQVVLPPVVRAWSEARGAAEVARPIRRYLLVLAAYCAATALALAFLAEPLTALVLPEYAGDLRYVYLLAPGLILFTLSSPFAIMFNVIIRYTTYFIAYGLGTLATAAVLGAALAGVLPVDLDGVMVLRSMVYVLIAGVIVAGFAVLVRSHPEFRFLSRRVVAA